MDRTTIAALATATTVGLLSQTDMSAYLWLLVLGFVIAFVLAFSVGANDVANSFGTAVGSGVVTLRQACILATIFETVGSILLGAKVSETIRKGIIDVRMYNGSEHVLMAGSISAMFVASWFLSPLLSGIMSGILFYFVRKFILNKANPVPNGLRALPVFYAVTMGINLFSILYTGAPLLGFDQVPWWGTLGISLGCALATALLVWFVVCPHLKKKIEREMALCPCETPLVEKIPSEPDRVEQPPSPEPEPPRPLPSPPAEDSLKVAFRLGDSDDADLDSNDIDTKNLDLTSGLNGLIGPMTITDPHSGRSHTIHKDSGLYKDLLLKLHVAKVGDCIGDSDTEERPIRRNNSYTSYTMAIYGIQGDPKYKEAVDATIGGRLQRRSRVDSYSSYSSAMSNGSRVEDGSVAQSEAGKEMAVEVVEQDALEVDHPAVSSLFQFLQILTACFGSFAHGGNDVSGSVVSNAPTPIWLLLYGGVGISAGLWVGSVVAVGWLRSRKAVDWLLFRNIFIAWFVTVPISGLISAAIMSLFVYVVL
ncbi:hypothetical protein CRUP_030999 [Coryphaenoides rupestris]|nr:hypothetical protein CRUP_030999 [Coryphaenoides rupestris]